MVRSKYIYTILGLFVAVSAITFLRTPDSFIYPPLRLDDRFIFQHFYNFPDSDIFIYLTNLKYIISTTVFIAYMAVNYVDITYVPYVFTGSSLLFLSACFMIILLPGYERFFSRNQRILLVLLMALLPAGTIAMVSVLMFQNWTFLLIGCLLTIIYPSNKPLAWLGMASVFFICIWDHPLSVIYIPCFIASLILAIYRLEKHAIAYYILLLTSCFLYLKFGIVSETSADFSYSISQYISLLWQSIIYTLDRVVVESLLGYSFRIYFIDRDLYWILPTLGGLIFVLIVGVFCHDRSNYGIIADVQNSLILSPRRMTGSNISGLKDPIIRRGDKLVVVFLYYIFAISFISLISRSEVDEVIRLERAFRYCYVQKYLWLIVVFYTISPIIAKKYVKPAAYFSIFYFIMLSLFNNTQYKTTLVSKNIIEVTSGTSLNHAQEGKKLKIFLQKVKDVENQLPEGEICYMILERDPSPMRLKVRKR